MNQWQLVGNVTNEKGRQVGEPARVNLFWAVESWASEYLPPRTLVVVCNRSTNLVIKKNICSSASLRFAGQKKSKSTNTRCRKVKEAKWSVLKSLRSVCVEPQSPTTVKQNLAGIKHFSTWTSVNHYVTFKQDSSLSSTRDVKGFQVNLLVKV